MLTGIILVDGAEREVEGLIIISQAFVGGQKAWQPKVVQKFWCIVIYAWGHALSFCKPCTEK